MNKVKRFLNKIEDNYRSFLWFVAKLVFWTAILIWLLPLLAGMFLNTFKSDDLKVGDFILFITAAFIIAYTYETQKQARATEKIAEQQMIPAVDVNMIYDPRKKKTYFWFSNNSNIPALVSIEASFTSQNSSYLLGPYRIPTQTNDKPTAPTFFDKSVSGSDKYHAEGVGATILVRVRPDVEDVPSNIGIDFKKSYNFHENKWDEKTWGGPDQQSSLYNKYYKEA